MANEVLTACRATIYPILNRLGIDILSGRIIHLRDDDRFKAVGPDAAVMSTPSVPHHNHQHSGPPSAGLPKPDHEEGEMWFDWAFVDFWKSNYCALPHCAVCKTKLTYGCVQIRCRRVYMRTRTRCHHHQVSVLVHDVNRI